MLKPKKKVVVIGGGTGTSVVLAGLKQFQAELNLNAVVVVFDSGGSTGALRDEFGFLAVGDIRQCLVALADGRYQDQVRELLLYRFKKGEGLKGHNLGNLILTALEDLQRSPGKAIEVASNIFRIRGRIFPITEADVQLTATYQNGEQIVGEHLLDDSNQYGGKKIKEISLTSPAKIYQPSAQAIKEADFVILGPGDLYASLLANTLVDGFQQTIKENKGKFIYITNLMTHYSQTHQMSAVDHVREMAKYCQRMPDLVICNQALVPKKFFDYYALYHEYPVIDDLDQLTGLELIRAPLLSKEIIKQSVADLVPRSILRHDADKLAQVILQYIKKNQ